MTMMIKDSFKLQISLVMDTLKYYKELCICVRQLAARVFFFVFMVLITFKTGSKWRHIIGSATYAS